jgi:hypothetical protein
MDTGSAAKAGANQAMNAAKANNRMLYLGLGGAAILGYFWYKRNSDVHNVGDAVCMVGKVKLLQ